MVSRNDDDEVPIPIPVIFPRSLGTQVVNIGDANLSRIKH